MTESKFNMTAPKFNMPEFTKAPKVGGAAGLAFMDPLKPVAMPTIKTPSVGLNFGFTGDSNAGFSLMNDSPSGVNNFSVGESGFGLGKGYGNLFDGSKTPAVPDVMGKWVQGVGLVKDVAQIGLGIYSAAEQTKMNKFMQSYYGDQMAMMKTDFSNAAQSANEGLSRQEQMRQSARGVAYDSDEMKQNVAAYMDQWGAKTTA